MGRRASGVLWGVGAVVAGALVLHWVHASSTGYAPAHPSYATEPASSNLPMLVLYSVLAVVGVCLAALGWWRPFIAAVLVAYLVPLVGGGIGPLLGEVPDRLSVLGMAALEAALLTAPAWLVGERGHLRARSLPIPTRVALPRRDQRALPRANHA